MLFTFLVGLVLSAIDVLGVLAGVFSLATFLPSLAVTVRRLRDAGFSWVWLLLPAAGFVPLTIGVVQFVVELVDLGLDDDDLKSLAVDKVMLNAIREHIDVEEDEEDEE